jgi:hypothetical protein
VSDAAKAIVKCRVLAGWVFMEVSSLNVFDIMLPYITFAEARLKSELPSILASIKVRKSVFVPRSSRINF